MFLLTLYLLPFFIMGPRVPWFVSAGWLLIATQLPFWWFCAASVAIVVAGLVLWIKPLVARPINAEPRRALAARLS